jgi:hypothetical protein
VKFTTPADDRQWEAQRVATLPAPWQSRILKAWEADRAKAGQGEYWTTTQEAANRAANLALLEITDQLTAVRLPLDASDAEICDRAQSMADQCAALAEHYHQAETLHRAMVRACNNQGIEPPKLKDKADGQQDLMPAIRRMVDHLWWRRQLRKSHAKAVEGAAIVLGLVNRKREPYVSTESLKRRAQQNRRNAEALENTTAVNELGQEFTLAELAAKGPANKAIRRAELMTRISGFERIAKGLDHAGLFLTITCPSRMHKWRTLKGGNVQANPRFDGTNPREAQSYLAKVWARIRASLKRQGVGIYGFRIAEPNHDATPHWHLLVFHQPGHLGRLMDTIKRYALADSPNEPGAHTHRVDFKPIDWSRGTAAGYIAKYVAKNIDGYKLEKDLIGNDALETSARVEAWAATWGIRQFQQVGGPPVTVWRELRRVEQVPDQCPDYLKQAHQAVNRHGEAETELFKAAAWDEYVNAQGGVFCGRKYRIRIATQEREGLGRYGEPLADAPVGVETFTRETYTPAHMAWMKPPGRAERVIHWFVESVRHVWTITTRAARAVEGLFKGPKAPWTRVNNCTEGIENEPGNQPGTSRASAAGGVVEANESMGRSFKHSPNHGGALRGAHDRNVRGHGGGIGRTTPSRQGFYGLPAT